MDSLLSLWSIMDMASQVTQGDYYQTFALESKILRTTMAAQKYDRFNPSDDGPIVIIPLFFIDHIEVIDEHEQVMVLHGGLQFIWGDNRIKWNSTEYGNVKQVTRNINHLKALKAQPFLPKIHATEMYSRTTDLLQSNGAAITITNDGTLIAKVRVQIRSTCHFAFDMWPHDRQNCSFNLYSPLTMNKVLFGDTAFYSTSRLKFNPMSGLPSVHDVNDFKLDSVSTDRVFMLPYSKVIDAEKALSYPTSFKKLIRSVYRIDLIFTRNNKYYTVHMAIPMFCISLLTYLLFLIKSLNGAIYLLLMIMIQSVNAIYLKGSLPPDYMTTPPIAGVASFLFLSTMIFLFWRLFTLYHKNLKNRNTPLEKVIYYGELGLRLLLPFFLLYDYFKLF